MERVCLIFYLFVRNYSPRNIWWLRPKAFLYRLPLTESTNAFAPLSHRIDTIYLVGSRSFFAFFLENCSRRASKGEIRSLRAKSENSEIRSELLGIREKNEFSRKRGTDAWDVRVERTKCFVAVRECIFIRYFRAEETKISTSDSRPSLRRFSDIFVRAFRRMLEVRRKFARLTRLLV